MSNPSELIESRQWLHDVELPERLAVGWSGGADSTALLLALQTRGHTVHAWHVDHAWHAASEEHGRHLQQLAGLWGIPFSIARVNVPPTVNREAESRRARMNQFEIWGREQSMDVLCLAHHLEDQAETVCLRMLQGAGVGGCRGMAAVRQHGCLKLMRPLLHVSKQEMEEALQCADVAWLTDPSNEDVSLLRNRIRLALFPAIRREKVDPVELFVRWQQQAVRVFEHLDSLANEIGLCKQSDKVSVKWTDLCDQPAAVRAVVLQRMAEALMGVGTVLGRRHIRLIDQWLEKGGNGGLDLSRCRIVRQHGNLNLLRRQVSLR